MAGENAGAMFYFDTNIDRVAANIQAALARINASLAEPLKLNAAGLASNTEMMGGFGRTIETQMDRRIKDLRGKISAGMNPQELRAEFQRSVSAFWNDIPVMMANGLGQMPASAANTAPAAKYAQEVARSYHGALRAALAASDPAIAQALKGVRFPVAEFNRVGKVPVAFGRETDPMSYYRNLLRAEGFLRRDPAFGTATRAATAAAGFSPAYMQDLQKRTVTTVGGNPRFTNPTDAAARLRDLRAEQATVQEQEALAARAERIDKERTAREEANQQRRGSLQARAERMDTERTARQAADVQRRGKIQGQAQSIDEQMANSQRVGAAEAAQPGSVSQLGRYRVLGEGANREVFKTSTFGLSRVTEEREVAEVLAKQERLLQSQLATEARLVQTANLRNLRQENSQTFTGGFANRFGRGGGSLLGSMGNQVASAASFTLGYGALFGAVGAIKSLQHEFSDYQDSLTDLQVATRSTDAVTNDWVNSLGDLARVTGENVGAALDTAARGVRAFGDPLHDSIKDLQDIGVAANTAANQLALVADKPLGDATGDTVAIGTAFGMQPDQLQQIVDAVSNAKRSLGGDSGQISQGLASISTSANEAGYSLNQAAAMISLVQARTDESGQAVATRLTKIFQVVSGSTGKNLGKELGVDTTQSTRKQLEDYSKIYNDPGTSKAVKDRITSQLGGTANLKELLPILREGSRLQEAYGDASKNAGQGIDEFNRKSNNLPGTLKKIHGDIKAIEVDLARTDIFAPFGVAVYALEPMLHLLDRMLKLFQQLPGGVQHTTAALVDLAIAAKVVSTVQATRATTFATKQAAAMVAIDAANASRGFTPVAAPTLGRVGAQTERAAAGAAARTETEAAFDASVGRAAATRAIAEAEFDATIGEAGVARNAAELEAIRARRAAALAEIETIVQTTEARRVAGLAEAGAVGAGAAESGAAGAAGAAGGGMLGGLKSIGKFATNPYTIGAVAIVGAALAINRVVDGIEQRDKFTKSFADTSHALQRGDGSATSLRAAADDLKATAGTISKSDASTGLAKDAQKNLSDTLTKQQGQLRDIAKGVAAEQDSHARDMKSSVFGDGGVITSVSQLTQGMTALADAGVTATGQMRVLQRAILDTASPQQGQKFNPKKFSADLMGDTLGTLHDVLPSVLKVPTGSSAASTYNYTSGQSTNTTGGYNPYPTAQGAGTVTRTFRNVTGDAAYAQLRKDNSPKEMDAAIQKAAKKLGIKDGDLISPTQREALIRAAVDSLDFSSIPTQKKEISEKLVKALLKQAQGGDGGLPSQFNGTGQLTPKQVQSMLKSGDWDLATYEQASEQAISPKDDGSKLTKAQRSYVQMLKSMRSRMGNSKNLGILNQYIDQAEDALAGTQIQRLEELRVAAQNKEGLSKNQVRDIGRASLAREIAKAGDDTKRLIDIMNRADNDSLDIVEAHLKRAAEISAQNEANSFLNPSMGKPRMGPGGEQLPNLNPPTTKGKTDAQKKYDAFVKGRGESSPSNDPYGGDFAGGTPDSQKLTAAQLAALSAQATTSPRNSVAQARVSLRVAKANLDAIHNKHSQEYFSALQTFTQAQSTLATTLGDKATAAAQAAAARAGGGAMANANAQITAANVALRLADGPVERSNAEAQKYAGEWAKRQAGASKVGAIASANASRIGGGLAQGRAALRGAAAMLHATARGTGEWWQQLGTMFQAQDQMRQAALQYKNVQDQLHGDITDPVENARDAVRAAVRKMRQDVRRGAGKDVVAQDRLDVRQGQVGEEAAKFQQRLSDWQTSEDLGRMSHHKHMQLLDHEHDRLTAIHKRTRQQQDELDTVDKAMKDAKNAMDSQFNLGDINTKGLVYQVRRFKADMAGGAGVAESNVTNQKIDIHINGAQDPEKLGRDIDRHLRIHAGRRNALTRRKV